MTKIAACLIVKDAEQTIETCLASIRPFVDEINVYDTGSTDGTLALLEKLDGQTEWIFANESGEKVGSVHAPDPDQYPPGSILPDYTITRDIRAPGLGDLSWPESQTAFDELTTRAPLAPIHVQEGEWRDDFAWAREQSWQMPSDDCEWLLWLDDDDTIEGAHHLRHLAATASPDLHGYIVQYDYARDENGNTVCQLWRERLIRRNAGYTWHGAVHEVLIPPEGTVPALAQVEPQMLRYVHRRELAPPDRYAPDRNLRILLAEKQRCEDNDEQVPPRTLAYIGTELMAKGQYAEAVPFLEGYVAREDARWADERAQVWHKLAMCLRMLGNPHAAIEAEFRSLRDRDNWAETEIGLAVAFQQLGMWERGLLWAKRCLEHGMPRSALILNPLEFTLLPLVTIADCAVALGDFDQARAAIHRAAQIAPAIVGNKAQEIEAAANSAEIAGAVLMLREILVRHDENWKAWQLLNAVPYLVAERPEIVQARAAQREMVAHALSPDEYQRWYEDEPKESTVPDELVAKIDEHIERAAFLLEGLAEQERALGRKPQVLDLGANDMWLACFLWHRVGIRCDGVELNRASVEKARARLTKFEAPGKVVQGDLRSAKRLLDGRKYDAVVLFEVLEHVPDVEGTLNQLEGLVKPGGVVYLTTPNGAFDRGQQPQWARVERKNHLRALPAHELAETLMPRGRIVDYRVHAQGLLTFAAYQPTTRKSRIVFYAGGSWEPWSPASLRDGGIGGSETALVQVATRLAAEGHDVRVFSGAEPGFYGGALYRPFTAWDSSEECDLLIVSRTVSALDMPLGARKVALWCHDHSYPGVLTEDRAGKLDHVIVLSEWQRDRFARLYPFLADKLKIIRNGITVREIDSGEPRYTGAERSFADRKPRAIYSSSADRGLDVLLDMWSRIRERVPNAELHVFYGWETFDRVAVNNPELFAYKLRILNQLKDLGGETGGVFMRGRVGQVELAREMEQARVLAYPTAFLETSCITAMEARAAGLPVVTSELAALAETAASGVLVSWDADEDQPSNTSSVYQSEFVETAVRLLTSSGHWADAHAAALDGAETLDWSERIRKWEALIPAVRRASGKRREKVAA